MRILVTGASGFIARQLCEKLISENFQLSGTVRSISKSPQAQTSIKFHEITTINGNTDWSVALKDIDVVVHLAARVHVTNETAADPLKEYLIVNAEGTKNLANQALQAGVKKFIFLSTVGVNGGISLEKPFTETDPPNPHNDYSTSKKVAEDYLNEISKNEAMSIVIIRAPIVYGPGNRGNFQTLVDFVSKGIPLPLASVSNKKSLLFVGNLVDAMVVCIKHPRAIGTYLVSDNEDISTPELISRIASTLSLPPRLFHFPLNVLKICATLLGKSTALERLTNTLVVDISKIKNDLGWSPRFNITEGLKKTLL